MHDICVHCGKFATVYNQENQPTCTGCFEKKPKRYVCKKCGGMMIVKRGKYGSFWGCSGYPLCDNTVSLKEVLIKEKNKTNLK
ncbi:MAG: topoisomerase DNA-binding C4 zinc finger domain-containing protein [Candidatus Aenigmatarchaeota archaeon]